MGPGWVALYTEGRLAEELFPIFRNQLVLGGGQALQGHQGSKMSKHQKYRK